MSALHDVTQEVWCVASMQEEDGRTPADVLIAVDRPSASQDPQIIGQEPQIIFSAWHHDPEPDEAEKARMSMAARAPTFYRLLEQVVALGSAPADLELIIKLNLYRAAPGVYPKPEIPNSPRKNAWQKLLDEDLG